MLLLLWMLLMLLNLFVVAAAADAAIIPCCYLGRTIDQTLLLDGIIRCSRLIRMVVAILVVATWL